MHNMCRYTWEVTRGQWGMQESRLHTNVKPFSLASLSVCFFARTVGNSGFWLCKALALTVSSVYPSHGTDFTASAEYAFLISSHVALRSDYTSLRYAFVGVETITEPPLKRSGASASEALDTAPRNSTA